MELKEHEVKVKSKSNGTILVVSCLHYVTNQGDYELIEGEGKIEAFKLPTGVTQDEKSKVANAKKAKKAPTPKDPEKG